MQFSGWKTYIVAAIGIILNGLVAMGYINADLLVPINSLLAFFGLGFLRAGVQKSGK